MNSDVAEMTQKEIMRQLYSLQKESVENDARLEAQMENVVRRLDKQDRLLEKMNEAFLNQVNILHSLEAVDKKINRITEAQSEWEKHDIAINKGLEALKEKTGSLICWRDMAEDRINALENKNAKTVFAVVKKIGSIVLTIVVTAIMGYLIGKFKG